VKGVVLSWAVRTSKDSKEQLRDSTTTSLAGPQCSHARALACDIYGRLVSCCMSSAHPWHVHPCTHGTLQGSLLTHVACFSLRTCSSSLQKWQSSTAFSPPNVSGTADDMLPQKRAAP